MISEYDIHLGKDVVGTATVEKQGLYYRFACRCKLSGSPICRVVVECGGHHENLGILAPQGGAFSLTTKLAAKRIGEGPFSFRVLPKHSGGGSFVAIYPEEPFAYLARLKNAYLEVRRGQIGVVIPDLTQDPRDSDPNP